MAGCNFTFLFPSKLACCIQFALEQPVNWEAAVCRGVQRPASFPSRAGVCPGKYWGRGACSTSDGATFRSLVKGKRPLWSLEPEMTFSGERCPRSPHVLGCTVNLSAHKTNLNQHFKLWICVSIFDKVLCVALSVLLQVKVLAETLLPTGSLVEMALTPRIS